MTIAPWVLHPDRALPVEPTQRAIARELYATIAPLPIISMHGHIDVGTIRRNEGFGDPAELFIIPDHYLVRMLVSQGASPADLGVRPLDGDAGFEQDHRAVWRRFAESWKLFRGTPTRYWLEHELVEIFGITEEPSAATADSIYDTLVETLARPEFRIRELFDRFNIEALSTTDAPASDLADHAALAAEGWGERVVPTFRPDALFYPDGLRWRAGVEALAARSGTDVVDYPSFVAAIEQRRSAFVAAGARATDHGHDTANTTPLDAAEAERIFAAGLRGPVDAGDGPGVRRPHALRERPHVGRRRAGDAAAPRGASEPLGHDRRHLRPGQGLRHPPPGGVHAVAQAAARRVRARPRVPADPVHHRRDRLLPRARPARRRLPVGPARGTVVVPGLPGRDGAGSGSR